MPDAIASTANYLHKHGWTPGLPWAVEVRRPEGFDWKTRSASFSGWSRLGFRRTDGKAMPHAGEATLFLPAGARGPAFLVTSNFAVIKRYNSSDAYALGVGHLGESGVDEWASAVLHFPNDIVAEVSCSISLNQDNVLRILGTKGRIEVPDFWFAGGNRDVGPGRIDIIQADGRRETIGGDETRICTSRAPASRSSRMMRFTISAWIATRRR